MNDKPLSGVRVADFTNMLMAPYTTQILGDMGADVVKVEAPGGDPIRGIGPHRNPGMGAIFLNTNRSKRSIVLDLKRPTALEAARRLIAGSDVLVYNRRPQVMERLGLSYEAVRDINPRIIYAGMFGYGQAGPYAHKPAFDDLIQGAVAIPSMMHRPEDDGHRYVPIALVDRGAGLWAVGQISAALYYRERTGRGQRIDMPMFEMMTSFVLGDHLSGRTFDPPLGPPGYSRLLSAQRKPYKTRDGSVCVLIYTDRHWRDFFEGIGRPEVMTGDPRFASMTSRTEHIDAIYVELAEILLTRTSAEWLDFFDHADIPAAPLHSAESLMADPHLEAVDFFRKVEHPSEGPLVDMAFPSQWSDSQPEPGRGAPRLGEHSVEILEELGFSSSDIATIC